MAQYKSSTTGYRIEQVKENLKKWLLARRAISFDEFKYYGYNADILAITERLYAIEIEIKTTSVNFYLDFEKGYKHGYLHQGLMANKFYFCVPAEIVKEIMVPDAYGLLTFDGEYNIHQVKKAPLLRDSIADEDVVFCGMATLLKGKRSDPLLISPTCTCEIDKSMAVNFRPVRKNGDRRYVVKEYNKFFNGTY